MKTIILPGFSPQNRDWANEVKDSLKSEAYIHEWKHWETGENKDFDLQKESRKVIELIGDNEIKIIAKSIGTLIAAGILPEIHNKLEKLILCGIPVNDLSEDELKAYDNLTILDPNKIIVIQNKDDNHGTLAQVQELLRNLNIEIREKPRDDHHYPYYEDFKKILS